MCTYAFLGSNQHAHLYQILSYFEWLTQCGLAIQYNVFVIIAKVITSNYKQPIRWASYEVSIGSILSHSGLVTPYSDIDLGHIGSDNGLVPEGNKPLPGPMLSFHQ